MPSTQNLSDLIHDQIIGHSVDLLRVAAGLRRDMVGFLRELEAKLVLALANAELEGLTSFQAGKVRVLLKQTRETIATTYGEMADAHNASMIRLAVIEGEVAVSAINAVFFGVEVASTFLTDRQLKSIVGKTLIEGAPSRDWWERQNLHLQNQFTDLVRDGIARGRTTPEMVRTLRGTKANNYADGIMTGTRRGVEALVRTSVQSVANEVRTETYRANDDVVKGLQWVATLDGRTTLICIGLNGLMWDLDYRPIGHDKEWPGPTAHWNCRSTQIAVLKSWEELGADGFRAKPDSKRFDRYLQEELAGLGIDEAKAANIIRSTRSSMDGQVARDLTFSDWLKTKSDSFANKLLGPTRADMWREGKLKLTDLTDQTNRPMTIEELERKVKNERIGKGAA